MIMSDVNDDTLAEMDELVAEGVPDFKLFTAYPGVFYSDDGAIFRAMQQTAKNGGLIMMHAENGMAIDVVAGADRRRRQDRPDLPRRRPLAGLRGRGDQPGDPPGRGGRRAGLHRPPVRARRAGRGPRRAATAARRRSPRRARSTCSCRSTTWATASRAPSSCARRRCARRTTWDDLWTGPRQGRPPARLDRPLPVRLPRPEGARPGRLPEDPERPARRRGPGRPAPRRRRRRRPDHAASAGSRSSRPRRRRCSGCTRSKGAIAVGSDADLVDLRPEPRGTRSRPRPTTWTSTTRATRAGRVQGGSDIVLSRGSVIVRDGEFTGRKGHSVLRFGRKLVECAAFRSQGTAQPGTPKNETGGRASTRIIRSNPASRACDFSGKYGRRATAGTLPPRVVLAA